MKAPENSHGLHSTTITFSPDVWAALKAELDRLYSLDGAKTRISKLVNHWIREAMVKKVTAMPSAPAATKPVSKVRVAR